MVKDLIVVLILDTHFQASLLAYPENCRKIGRIWFRQAYLFAIANYIYQYATIQSGYLAQVLNRSKSNEKQSSRNKLPGKGICRYSTQAVSEGGVSSKTAHDDQIKTCYLCGGPHRLWQCLQFRSMSERDRQKTAREGYCCFNCLEVGHRVRDCKWSRLCKICQKKHNTPFF